MQFHILDENYTPVTVMDNDLPDAINFNNSKFHRFLIGSADFFDFETSKLHVDHQLFQVGYWLAFRYDDRDRLQYINEIEEAESDKMMTISSASSNLDLNNETKEPFSATEAKPFKWYFDIIMFDTGYEIGINEISNLTRKLSWDSSMTIRAFIQSVATQFDNAELDYEVVLNSDFTIKKRLVHIKKKIGEVRDDIELRYGDNVKTVKRTTSISELCTAVRPVSKDDNDKVIDISSLNDWQELDENGNVKFFHKKGSDFILAPQANARFGNRGHNVTGGGYIVHDFSYDKVSQNELFNRSHIYLKEHSVPAINYEVDGRTGAKIGDTVKIVDDGYTPELILSARVLEQVVSFDDATVEQATFGNYKALQSKISADLITKMQQLAEENAPYKAVTLTTNGLTFKNSAGSTTLTARLYKGSKEIVPESYEWTIDGVAISEKSEQHDITADDINGKAVVRWSAIINGVMVAFDEVTVTDVSDGANGVSPTVKINPDTSLTIIDAQGTSTTPALKGDKGNPTGITKSATEPENKFDGMIWYVDSNVDVPSTNMEFGTAAQSNGQYTWNGTKWSLYMLRSINMMVDNGFITNAMIANAEIDNAKIKDATIESAKIKSINADKINANTLQALSAKIGKIYNEFDNSSGGIDDKGAITIEDSVKVVYYLGNSSTTIDLVTSSSGQGLFTQYLPDKTDASKFKQSWYMPTGLYFTDSINNWNGQITAENVTLAPWQNLILRSGYTTGDGVQPQYRRIKNLDGSYSVQFRGAISPTSGNFSTTQVWAATVTGVYRPPTTAMRQCSDNTGKGGRVTITTDGGLYVMSPNNSSYVYIDSLTYIN